MEAIKAALVFGLGPLVAIVLLYVAVRLASAAYFRSLRDHEDERTGKSNAK